MQQRGILDLDGETFVSSSVEMQLDMMLTSFSENFLELLIPHKGYVQYMKLYRIVCPQLSWDVRV